MTKQQIDARVSKNNWLDKLFMGMAGGAILVLAGHDAMQHIKMVYPLNVVLAAGFVGFLSYVAVAPILRK